MTVTSQDDGSDGDDDDDDGGGGDDDDDDDEDDGDDDDDDNDDHPWYYPTNATHVSDITLWIRKVVLKRVVIFNIIKDNYNIYKYVI